LFYAHEHLSGSQASKEAAVKQKTSKKSNAVADFCAGCVSSWVFYGFWLGV
jgi:hypothetical protein